MVQSRGPVVKRQPAGMCSVWPQAVDTLQVVSVTCTQLTSDGQVRKQETLGKVG